MSSEKINVLESRVDVMFELLASIFKKHRFRNFFCGKRHNLYLMNSSVYIVTNR